MVPTIPQPPLTTTTPRRRIRRLTGEDAAVLAIIRATRDDAPVRGFDPYELALRMLDGRVTR